MKYQSFAFAALMGLAHASPYMRKREVPQEHSHEIYLDLVRKFLDLNNPKKIADPVFGLLGDAAAAAGAGSVTNLACLKQETADQAFTNAKAINDVGGMAAALVFQALERNTGGVGVKSATCTETPVNAQIGALSQHQDPASENAAAGNKAITLELAKQLALIGADPLLALESGTFAPGQQGDTTGRGNACDVQGDNPGCIYSQRLLVLDATEDEIQSAVAGIKPTFTGTGAISATDINFTGLSVAAATGAVATAAANNAAAANAAAAATTPAAEAAATTPAADAAAATSAADAANAAAGCAVASSSTCTVITTTVPATATNEVLASVTPAADVAASAAGTNIQAFTGTLGGAAPPVVSSTGTRPFEVNGDTFVGSAAALGRSCDIQHNACANAANSGKLAGGVAQCEAQLSDCETANALRRRQLRLRARALNRRAAEHNAATDASLNKRQLDFGSCTDPSIIFATSLDGRTGEAFAPHNEADFNHGSALNIGVISSFICQRLSDSCKAPAATVQACQSGAAAASAVTQDQTAADTFNAALGVSASGATSAVTPTTGAKAATTTQEMVVMTITQCA